MDKRSQLLFLTVITLHCYMIYGYPGISKSPDSLGTFSTRADGTGHNLIADPGQSVTVLCVERVGPNENNVYLSWSLNGRAISTTPGKYERTLAVGTSSAVSRLTIHSLSQEDEGIYRCASGSNDDLMHLNVTDEGPPSISGISGNTNPDLGSQITLECNAEGNPSPLVEWRRLGPNQNIQPPQPGQVQNQLIISSVSLDDAGYYECVATNVFGSVQQTIQVLINSPPSISGISGDTSADLGGQITLECNTEGTPPPHVQWRRLSPNQNMPPLEPGNQNQLIISSVSLDDAGDYECVAANVFGEVQQTVQIRVNSETPAEIRRSCSIPCEPITISQCISQSHSMTGFPNFFNRTSQATAAEIADNIDIAVAVGCSKATTKFLCGLLVPECRENQGLVMPKRQTCKEFYAGCGDILRATRNEELIFDCDVYFSENPEPVCSAKSIVPTNPTVIKPKPASSGGDKRAATDAALRVTSAVALTPTSVQVDFEGVGEAKTVTSNRVRMTTSDGYFIERYLEPTIRSTVFYDQPSDYEFTVTVQAIYGTVYGTWSEPFTVAPYRPTGNGNRSVKPRRTDVADLGTPCLFRGWVDVQGQGAANDYCRVVSTGGQQFLSCALAGSNVDHPYTSSNASVDWFDAGHMDTWYMTDKDGDGRDDYCRCIGVAPNTVVSCMKAGATGFISHDDFQIPGTTGCHYDKVNPFFGRP